MGYRRMPFDGGVVEYVVAGPEDATELLIFHVGTPSAAVVYPSLVRHAGQAGLVTATYSRAGYGASTRRQGRSVADEAAVSAALADRLGFDRFVTLGWSGGGPPALACAALLGDRVRACLALASVAPRTEAGAAWDAWFAPEQLDEFSVLATGDPTSLIDDYASSVEVFGRMTPRRLRALAGPPDPRSLAYAHDLEVEPALIRSMRRAVLTGFFGFVDDNVSHVLDWGFRVADIRVPVVVRHGELDRLVNVGHGRWLESAIPGARGVFHPDAGHGSIALPWAEVVADLMSAAGYGAGEPPTRYFAHV